MRAGRFNTFSRPVLPRAIPCRLILAVWRATIIKVGEKIGESVALPMHLCILDLLLQFETTASEVENEG